ncbi:hypothetical protein SAMN05192553_101930 [Cyclobacterium xiamenense]|uniref:Uncharacterized protein n=1 Tax=Cyclobacterium xiamenense TaxID=1297121 RepID=A0A1H6UN75_9BACT|nr:hypothetical protein SAMN05192553_101930 [Cyclobacterium xiamenense]
MSRFYLIALLCLTCGSLPAQNQIQTHTKNPHYFSWGSTLAFLIGAAGFQLKEETIQHSTKRLSVRIPADLLHLIAHIKKVNQ